jgi:hypothetical protein
MLTMNLLGRCEVDALFDAWVCAADDATLALHAWSTCDARDRSAAYSVYQASLDREEHAARLLAAKARTLRGRRLP